MLWSHYALVTCWLALPDMSELLTVVWHKLCKSCLANETAERLLVCEQNAASLPLLCY